MSEGLGLAHDGATSAVARLDVDHSLELAPHGLRFTEPATERNYRAWYVERERFFTRLGLLASLSVWMLVLVGLSVVIDGGFDAVAPWCFGSIVMIGLTLSTTVVRPLVRYLPIATATANAIAGLAVVGVSRSLSDISSMDLTVGGMGIIIALMFAFAIFRQHPATAAIQVLVYVVVYEIALTEQFRADRIDAASYWTVLVITFSSYLTGIVVSVQFERQMREMYRDERTIARQGAVIEEQRRQADELLRNILPDEIAAQLKQSPGVVAEHFDGVTVLFADVVGFTPLAANVAPTELVELLNEVFSAFDELAAGFGVEKIKTIGDAYMAVAGLPKPRADHAPAAANLALAMRDDAASRAASGSPIELRIGLASGPAVAGVIGLHKFAYDLWGDTVNMAARMESHGVPGEIQVSAETHDLLVATHELVPRGSVEVKGKGSVDTWLLVGRRT